MNIILTFLAPVISAMAIFWILNETLPEERI